VAAKVRKDAKGRYWVIVHHNGRRKKKYAGRDKQRATELAEKIWANVVLGDLGIGGEEEQAVPFKPFAESWLRSEVSLPAELGMERALAPNTVRSRTQSVRLHLAPFFEEIDIRSIRVADIQRLYERCLEKKKRAAKKPGEGEGAEKPISRRSIEIILGTLRLILAHAQAQDLVASNVLDAWKAVRGRRRGAGLQPVEQERVLTSQELTHLLGTARQHLPAVYPLVLFLADTGCRIGEALALRWIDVNLKTGVVRIERSVDHSGRVGPTKTRRARAVELSTRLSEVFTRLRPEIHPDDALVFPSEAGGFVESGNFRRRGFGRLVKKAFEGAKQLTPHCLRHTWASLHLARGTNLKWVQETGGWTSAKMLLDVYGHHIPTETRGFADALSDPIPAPKTHSGGPYTAPDTEKRNEKIVVNAPRVAYKLKKPGADGRIRTADLLITNQLLYQLSYVGPKKRVRARSLCVALFGGRWPYIFIFKLRRRTQCAKI